MKSIHPSVMFHHFHGMNHYCSQGSISAEDLHLLIKKIKKTLNIISAEKYMEMCFSDTLQSTDISFTFDDGLLCQYDIALDVLDYWNIKAFWFIPSEAIEKQQGHLEIYRYFRSVYFKDEEDFYQVFFSRLDGHGVDLQKAKKLFFETNHLGEFGFYSQNDRFFRYLRDVTLGPEQYFEMMGTLMREYNMDTQKISSKLWLSEKHLQDISANGHILGAHSYTHPTDLSSLSRTRQKEEYISNINHLKKCLKKNIYAMAHPCNSYNQDTLEVLKNLGIKIGFRSNNKRSDFTSLELPRIDHTEIINI
jgi:peptidoglycan/xylan/chitin deacetylase (PgdA/CDA1 family)